MAPWISTPSPQGQGVKLPTPGTIPLRSAYCGRIASAVVVGAILVRAGHKEGYRVIFQDKTGLAIRNGGVYAQMTFVQDEERRSAGAAERRRQFAEEARSERPDLALAPLACLAADAKAAIFRNDQR